MPDEKEERVFEDVEDVADWYKERIPTTEEDTTMMHEPNSIEARNQYVRMELAEWSTSDDTYAILNRLFDFPFNPKTDGDYDLKTRIIDYRVNFFGFGSRWAKEVTFAEVILHYARLANFNYDESVRYWADYFLQFVEIGPNTSSRDMDDVIDSLNNHMYANRDTATFGLFGLTSEQMNRAVDIANKNIDNSLTYEIEFNEFLKGCI